VLLEPHYILVGLTNPHRIRAPTVVGVILITVQTAPFILGVVAKRGFDFSQPRQVVDAGPTK